MTYPRFVTVPVEAEFDNRVAYLPQGTTITPAEATAQFVSVNAAYQPTMYSPYQHNIVPTARPILAPQPILVQNNQATLLGGSHHNNKYTNNKYTNNKYTNNKSTPMNGGSSSVHHGHTLSMNGGSSSVHHGHTLSMNGGSSSVHHGQVYSMNGGSSSVHNRSAPMNGGSSSVRNGQVYSMNGGSNLGGGDEYEPRLFGFDPYGPPHKKKTGGCTP